MHDLVGDIAIVAPIGTCDMDGYTQNAHNYAHVTMFLVVHKQHVWEDYQTSDETMKHRMELRV